MKWQGLTVCLTVVSGLIGAFMFGHMAAAESIPPALASLQEQRQAIAAGFAKQVASCSRRQDTSHAAFKGCVDWHSAVHGVWALLAYQRATGDRQYEPLVTSILSKDGLAAERKYLAKSPGFEMPYGRSWFLRLAIEYRKLTASDDLTAFADDVAESMRRYYRGRTIDRFSEEYDSDSWAMINLLDYARARGLSDMEAEVVRWIRVGFVDPEPKCSYDRERGQYMAICTNWASLAARVLDRQEFTVWIERFIALNGLPNPVEHPATDHEFGLNFSRAWGLWDVYERTGRADVAQAYAAHMQHGLTPASNWSGAYMVVGHWVSQFGMYAVQPLFEARGRSLASKGP